MAKLDTTVAVYDHRVDADADWVTLERAAQEGDLQMADAALIENQSGKTVILQRESHHGWGKGAVVGAVVGIIFPPSVIGAAAVGAGGGALVAGIKRALNRDEVMKLGDTLSSEAVAILVVSPSESTNAVSRSLKRARRMTTVPTGSAEDVEAILRA